MSLRDLFCHGGEKNANIRIGILIGSLSFVVIFFISVVIFLRCYMERRRSNYRKKFNAAAIREEKADEDVYKLLTYLAYLRKMRLIHYPTKRLEPNQTRNLLTDDNWVELRRQAYEEIMSLYGTEECHISPSHGAHLDQSVFSTMSVSSSISAKEREHLQWYQENVAAGHSIPDNLELGHSKSPSEPSSPTKSSKKSESSSPSPSPKVSSKSPEQSEGKHESRKRVKKLKK